MGERGLAGGGGFCVGEGVGQGGGEERGSVCEQEGGGKGGGGSVSEE